MKWLRAARGIGGTAAIATLLAHFWLPSLPLSVARVELLLLIIGLLLGMDAVLERWGITVNLNPETDQIEDSEQQGD